MYFNIWKARHLDDYSHMMVKKIGVYSFPSVQEIQLLCVRCHDTGSMIKEEVGKKIETRKNISKCEEKKFEKYWYHL